MNRFRHVHPSDGPGAVGVPTDRRATPAPASPYTRCGGGGRLAGSWGNNGPPAARPKKGPGIWRITGPDRDESLHTANPLSTNDRKG